MDRDGNGRRIARRRRSRESSLSVGKAAIHAIGLAGKGEGVSVERAEQGIGTDDVGR